MRAAALGLLIVAAVLPLSAAEVHVGATILLTPDEAQDCIDGGGCLVITRRAYEALRGSAESPRGFKSTT